MHFVAFSQKVVSEVRAILTRNACDQCSSHGSTFSTQRDLRSLFIQWLQEETTNTSCYITLILSHAFLVFIFFESSRPGSGTIGTPSPLDRQTDRGIKSPALYFRFPDRAGS